MPLAFTAPHGSEGEVGALSAVAATGGQRGWTERRALGQHVAEARRRAGLSQKELAEKLQMTLWAVAELEQGTRDPRDHLDSLHAVLGKSLGYGGATGRGTAAQLEVASARAVERGRSDELLAGKTLVLGTVAALVVIRLFTDKVGVLPGAANFIDLPLAVVLIAAVLVRPVSAREGSFFVPGLFFLIVCVVSTAVNLTRVDVGPVLLFVYGFLGPLAFYYATYRLWPPGEARSASRLIVGLLLVEFLVVGLIDLPTFARSRNPDDISGTFGDNAYQLVFFLIVAAALVAGISTFEKRRLAARAAPALLAGCFLVIFLAQYRALLFTTAAAAVLVAFLLATVRGRGLVTGTVMVTACILGLSYVATYFPVTKFSTTISAIRQDPGPYFRGRLAPITTVTTLFADNPRFVATGTGPGTYSSRAWRTFARPDSRDQDPASGVAALLTSGRRYTTDVSNRYTLPQYSNPDTTLGSRALQSPFSSYASLLAEVGLFGFLLLIGIYVIALLQCARMAMTSMRHARPGDPLPALLLAATVAFFVLLQMAALENWLEVMRVTIPAWVLFAIGRKELDARREDGARSGGRVAGS